MNIEQIELDTILTDRTRKKVNQLERIDSFFPSFQKIGRTKYVALLILILLALTFAITYFKPLNNEEYLVDFKKHSFFELTSPADPNIQWDVFVDTSNNQVFLIRNIYPGSEGTRRLLADDDQDQTSITQVIQRKFNDDHLTIYQLFEGDFEHVHCFRIKDDSHSELIPLLKTSQFSEKTKETLSDFERTLLESPESGLAAEIYTDLQGELLGLEITRATGGMIERDKSYSVNPKPIIKPIIDVIKKGGKKVADYVRKLKPEPRLPEWQRRIDDYLKETGQYKTSEQIWKEELEYKKLEEEEAKKLKPENSKPKDPKNDIRLVSQVAESFDIDILKTKLYEGGKCFEYSLEFKKPENTYDTSKMKCSTTKKINEKVPKPLENCYREGIRAQPCGCEVSQCFEVPSVNKTNVGWENRCLKYDACLPTSICSKL